MRITAQLVKTSDGYHLWSERYDRDLDHVFAVQDEIARAIAALLDAGSLSAHHSFSGVFDAQKVLTVKGGVTRFEWVNPHSFIYCCQPNC